MKLKTFIIEKILGKCDHDWAKCKYTSTGIYLYGQKFCTKCLHRAAGYADKELPKDKTMSINSPVFNWS